MQVNIHLHVEALAAKAVLATVEVSCLDDAPIVVHFPNYAMLRTGDLVPHTVVSPAALGPLLILGVAQIKHRNVLFDFVPVVLEKLDCRRQHLQLH